MKIKVETDDVRIPGHPKAKRGAIKRGAVVEVEENLARMLVYSKRASFLDPSKAKKKVLDIPQGTGSNGSEE